MFKEVDIKRQLAQSREKNRKGGEMLLNEAQRILQQDLFTEEKILANLKQYNRAHEVLDEEALDDNLIFTLAEIKQVCVLYRLKFLESKVFKPEIPYEAVLRIKGLNEQFAKSIKEFRMLAMPESFAKQQAGGDALLFAKTNYGNYYLIHRWGKALPWHRKINYWPLRYFENLFLTVIAFTLILTLSLPIGLITLDPKADYWSGYRAAAFFHLLIFNMGVTAYVTFSFSKNFSSSIWNRERDFD
jgi:hypothetical protein